MIEHAKNNSTIKTDDLLTDTISFLQDKKGYDAVIIVAVKDDHISYAVDAGEDEAVNMLYNLIEVTPDIIVQRCMELKTKG